MFICLYPTAIAIYIYIYIYIYIAIGPVRSAPVSYLIHWDVILLHVHVPRAMHDCQIVWIIRIKGGCNQSIHGKSPRVHSCDSFETLRVGLLYSTICVTIVKRWSILCPFWFLTATWHVCLDRCQFILSVFSDEQSYITMVQVASSIQTPNNKCLIINYAYQSIRNWHRLS